MKSIAYFREKVKSFLPPCMHYNRLLPEGGLFLRFAQTRLPLANDVVLRTNDVACVARKRCCPMGKRAPAGARKAAPYGFVSILAKRFSLSVGVGAHDDPKSRAFLYAKTAGDKPPPYKRFLW